MTDEKSDGAKYYRLNCLGVSYAQIANLYGTTRGTVAGAIQRYRAKNENPPAPVKPKKEQIEQVVESENAVTYESKSRRITTLEQLIDYCQIDLSVWEVERHVINKWEVGAKNENDQLVIEPLYQVKVWLTRRNPEPIKPVIRPVNIVVRHAQAQPPRRGMAACLVLPDTQFGFRRDFRQNSLTPFHDRAALAAMLALAAVLQPARAVFLGDIIDFSGWSDKYIREPAFYATTQPALIEGAWYIGRVKALAGVVDALEGNHDVRVEKQMMTHLADAYGLRSADNLDAPALLSVDNLMGLSRMGVTYTANYPDGAVWLNDTTKFIHGEKVRSSQGATAGAVVREANETVIFGHIHRVEMAKRTIATRHGQRVITAYSPGCLCHTDGRVPGSKSTDQWQQGAAVVWYDSEHSVIDPIDISSGCAYWHGEVYEGEDYVGELEKQSGWKF